MSIDFSEYTFDIANPEKKRKIMTNIERYVREGTNVDEVDWENMPKREDEEPAPKYKSTPEEKKDLYLWFCLEDLMDKFKEGDYDDPYSTVEKSWIDINDGEIIITPDDLNTDPQRFASAMNDMLKALKDIKEPIKPVIIHDKEKEIILGYLKDYKEAFKSGKYYHPNDQIMRANLWVGNTRIDPWDLGARKEDFDRAMDDMIATLAEHGLKGEPAVVID